MLTKDLLEVEKRRPNIKPRYRDLDEYRQTAEQVVAAYQPGRTRGEIEDAIAELETHDTFKLVRGLSKLLERRATFEQQAPVAPERLREAVFDRGFVTSTDERDSVLEAVATTYDLTPAEVDTHLWADREEAEVLVEAPEIEPTELLRHYNLSLTQTLLFDAVELSFSVSDNYQELFGLISYLGLMYNVAEDLTVTVTGPAALFKQTRKYGTTLAKLVPSIMKAEDWSLTAQVETEVSDETRIYEFSLDASREALFPDHAAVESFDSEVERDFATRISSLAEGWTVTREPTILRTDTRVMIPDFSFERDDAVFYLEVIGFWTPDYLEDKLEKVRHVESEYPIILAVNETLNCNKQDFDDANVEQVFFYEDRIPVKPVLKRLRRLEADQVDRDLNQLQDQAPDIPTDEPTDLQDFAAAHGVALEAAAQYLTAEYDGVVSNDMFVPDTVLAAIEADIDALDSTVLADVNHVLEEYGVAQGILDEIGYSVNYVSLNQDEAEVTKTD